MQCFGVNTYFEVSTLVWRYTLLRYQHLFEVSKYLFEVKLVVKVALRQT